jgi:serine/threonine protein kinase
MKIFPGANLRGHFIQPKPLPRKRSSEGRRASDPSGQSEFRARPSTQTLPIPHQEGITWKRGQVLGNGAWGTVYEALNIQSGALMAVKQVPIKLDDAAKQSQAQTLEREIAMMTVLSHPNIVKIIGSEIKDDKINILMEYVPGKSLSTQLKQFGPFSEEHARKYARQLVEALAYCHNAGVVHRDIKGANVLVTLSGNPKLADFGSAKRLADVEKNESLSQDFNYTTEWTAPEVFSKGEFNSKVDIWSLGCVVIEMTTAQTPWAEHKFNNREHAMFFIGSNDAVPAIPPKLSPEGQDFVLRCLQRNPEVRASAKELLEHPWIANLVIDRQFETMSLDPRPTVSLVNNAPRPPYVPAPEVVVVPPDPEVVTDLANSEAPS